MRTQIPTAGSSESENSQVFSSPIRNKMVPSSPSRKESLADRVHRTRRHRTAGQPPSPTTAGESIQIKKSEGTELVQKNIASKVATEHRQDVLDTPKRKTMALAQAHHRKNSARTGTPDTGTSNSYQATPTDVTKEERAVVATPMEIAVVATPMERAVVATPMERAVVATPMERVVTPMEKKPPSLHEKKMRAIARVNKSPRRSPATAAASGSLSKNKFFADEHPEKSVHEVAIQPEADISRKFASRYRQAAFLNQNTAKATASESQPTVAEAIPRYFIGSSVPKVPTANRFRLNSNKSAPAPAEEKKEEIADIEPEGAAPKTSRGENEASDKLNMANMKFRYGVSLYKQAEPLEQANVQDVPVLKRSGYNAATIFQPTEESKPYNTEPTTQKPDLSANTSQYRNPSQSEPTRVVATPERVERPATWKSRSSTPSKRSAESRGQGAPSYRGQVQRDQEEQVHPEIKSTVSIETPGKVKVSNMKAMFSPTGSKYSETKRAASAPRPMMTGRNRTATKTPERAQSRNVHTIEAAQLSVGKVRREDISTRPANEVVVDPNEKILTEESRAVIETPEKVCVSNMKGMFNTHGTPSFYRTTTPHNTPATPPKSVRPGSDVSTPHGPSPPQRPVYNSAPTTIESWKNRYPSPNQAKTKLSLPLTKRTPPASDAVPQRNASPLPPASHRTPSRRSMATEQDEVREVAPRSTPTERQEARIVAPPPVWESSDPATENVAPKEAYAEPHQMEKFFTEQKTVSKAPEIIAAPRMETLQCDRLPSVEVPQSPRDRSSSIPKWEKPTKATSPSSPSTRPSSIPALPRREASPSKQAPEHAQAKRAVSTPSTAANNVSSDREAIDPNPVRETIQSDARSPSSSPRNRERPWKSDLQTLSPRSWERRRESSFDVKGDAEKRQQKPTLVEGESYSEEKKKYNMENELPLASTGSLMSLTQMATNSSHAVDYEQMKGLVKTAVSYDDEESNYSGGTGGTGEAIPVDLPPEFARAIAHDKASEANAVPIEKRSNINEVTQLISKARELQAKALSREKLDKACNGLNKTVVGVDSDGHSIVFGDPNTYGTAGGDAGQTPPRVADRAKAIANWKGGLGVKPPPASVSKFDQIYDLAPSQSSPRDNERIEDPHADIVFGNPTSFGVAGAEALNDSPVAKSPESRRPLSSPKSPGAKVMLPAPPGVNIPGSKDTSAVTQFWASTSEDELTDALNWFDKDPVLEDIYATDIGDITPEEVEEQLLGTRADEHGFPKSVYPKTAGNSPPKGRVNTQAPDPFAFDAVAALSLCSTKNAEVKSKAANAFDPFMDGATDAPANFGASAKFFTEETFSEPTFTPRANEEYMPRAFEQGGIGTTALAAPSLSSSEGSDPVTGQQVFSKYSKLGPSRSGRKSIESEQSRKQRRTVTAVTTKPKTDTAKPKQRMVVTDTSGIPQLSMSIETNEQRKERKLLEATVKSTERTIHTENQDPENNVSDSTLLFDPWSYDADAPVDPNTSGFSNTSGFGFEI